MRRLPRAHVFVRVVGRPSVCANACARLHLWKFGLGVLTPGYSALAFRTGSYKWKKIKIEQLRVGISISQENLLWNINFLERLGTHQVLNTSWTLIKFENILGVFSQHLNCLRKFEKHSWDGSLSWSGARLFTFHESPVFDVFVLKNEEHRNIHDKTQTLDI